MADTKYSIRQGESIELIINALDENGSPLTVSGSTITNILVTMSNKSSIFGKYSLSSMGSDWGDLETSGSVITIQAERSNTKDWDSGVADTTVTVETLPSGSTDYSVYDYLVTDFLEIYPSTNAGYSLIH